MDETRSAPDPIATAKIEDLIDGRRADDTLVIVTLDMRKAARVSQRTAFFHLWARAEAADTEASFTNPGDERTLGDTTDRYG